MGGGGWEAIRDCILDRWRHGMGRRAQGSKTKTTFCDDLDKLVLGGLFLTLLLCVGTGCLNTIFFFPVSPSLYFSPCCMCSLFFCSPASTTKTTPAMAVRPKMLNFGTPTLSLPPAREGGGAVSLGGDPAWPPVQHTLFHPQHRFLVSLPLLDCGDMRCVFVHVWHDPRGGRGI